MFYTKIIQRCKGLDLACGSQHTEGFFQWIYLSKTILFDMSFQAILKYSPNPIWGPEIQNGRQITKYCDFWEFSLFKIFFHLLRRPLTHPHCPLVCLLNEL